MSEGTVGLIVFLGCAVGAALVSHWLIRRYGVATFVATLVANTLFQVFAYLHDGHLDKFFLVALFFGAIYAGGIALVVGIPFEWYRQRQRRQFAQNHCLKCGYDLTGNESGRCPECGTPAGSEASLQQIDAP